MRSIRLEVPVNVLPEFVPFLLVFPAFLLRLPQFHARAGDHEKSQHVFLLAVVLLRGGGSRWRLDWRQRGIGEDEQIGQHGENTGHRAEDDEVPRMHEIIL